MSEISERSGELLTKEAHAEGLRAYREAGQKREQAIGNRGPLRLGDNGKLHPDILEAFHTQLYFRRIGVRSRRCAMTPTTCWSARP